MEVTKQGRALKRYDVYKDSGVEWLGEIPEHWETKRFKFIANTEKGKIPRKIVSISDQKLPVYMSMEYLRGGIPNQWVSDKNAQVLSKGELLLLWDGSNSGEFIISREGVMSSTVALIKVHGVNSDYIWFYSKLLERELRGNTVGMGIPHVNGNYLKDLLVLVPDRLTQTTISSYLRKKTTKIDQAIAIKERQIELLKERQQVLIQRAVTKGLDPDAKMKDSGVEWIGEIPEGWEIKKVKHVLKERNQRSRDGKEPLLMMSQIHGLVIRSDHHEKVEVAQSIEGNKIVKQNDLVFNKLKAHLGVFFKSTIELDGIVSPDYAVYYSTGEFSNLKFLELLFRNPKYIREFICRATGIVEGLIRLYTSDLFDLHIAIPPIEEQSRILEYIEQHSQMIQKAISIKKQEIEKLKEYKASLIDSVVTGKIKVC